MSFSYNFGEDFDFEPDWEVEKKAIIRVLARHFKHKCDLQDYQADLVAEAIYDLDITEQLEELFEDELTEELADDAKEAYDNMLADEQDFYDYFGTKDDVRGC